MEKVSTVLQEKVVLFLFYALISASLIAPIAIDSYIPAIADYINHLATIIQAKLALTEGQFPIRVMPADHHGLRYALYQFYSPTTYTLAGAIYTWMTPSNPLIAFKLTAWLAMLCGGIYMNKLAYWFIKSKPAALLASIVYLTSPYYLVVVNSMGDLSEMLGLGILPAALFYTLESYIQINLNKTLLKMSAAWYLLLTTHLITFFYGSLAIGSLLFFMTLKNKNHRKNLLILGVAYAFTYLLGIWFIAPILSLGKYFIIAQTLTHDIFMQFRPLLSHLLFPGTIHFQDQFIYNHASVGWLILAATCITAYAIFYGHIIHQKRKNYWLTPLFILFLFYFFIAWSPVDFWKWLPNLFMVGQYSWRFLGQLIWIGAILFAWSVCWLFKPLDRRHIVLGILLIVIASSAWLPTTHNSNINMAKFIQDPLLIYNANTYSINFNKNTQFVNHIDNMILYLLINNQNLQTDIPYQIPPALLNLAYQPKIEMNGTIPDELDKGQLNAVVNQKIIASKQLIPGKFHWDIPLASFKNEKSIQLQFTLQGSNQKKTKNVISIKKLVLTGFLNPTETLYLDQVQPLCSLKKFITTCHIQASPSIKLIELPIIYYPNLLNIQLNHQTIPYQSVLVDDELLTVIKPIPGMNIIQIEFTGIRWANRVSIFAWGMWVFLLIVNVIVSVKRSLTLR